MKKEEALAFAKHLEAEAKEKGQWSDINHENHPDLTKIIVVISIKIDK